MFFLFRIFTHVHIIFVAGELIPSGYYSGFTIACTRKGAEYERGPRGIREHAWTHTSTGSYVSLRGSIRRLVASSARTRVFASARLGQCARKLGVYIDGRAEHRRIPPRGRRTTYLPGRLKNAISGRADEERRISALLPPVRGQYTAGFDVLRPRAELRRSSTPR